MSNLTVIETALKGRHQETPKREEPLRAEVERLKRENQWLREQIAVASR